MIVDRDWDRPRAIIATTVVVADDKLCAGSEIQAGDVPRTYADIDATRRDLGFEPSTPISVGIPKFIAWYREFLASESGAA